MRSITTWASSGPRSSWRKWPPPSIVVWGASLAPAMRWIARRSLGRVNVACTNVPGVAEPRSMAGAPIESIFPFASVVEGTPLVVALLSYAGRIELGIDTDPEAIPDPHRIAELFEAALEEYEKLAPRA